MVNTYRQATAHAPERQVTNNAGGKSYQVQPLDRLERFLILGTVGGTFYVHESKLTEDNIRAVSEIIDELGVIAVDKILEIGKSNRAPKHDPALAAFAVAASSKNPETKAYALAHFNEIIRTGTHLFHFLTYIDGRTGWGRSLRRAVGKWYTEKKDQDLAYQVMKYKQRDGWSHRDVLRLAHPQSTSQSQNAIFKFVTSGTLNAEDNDAHRFIEACIEVSEATSTDKVVSLIKEYRLPMEVLPTHFKNKPEVWEALAPHMGLTALLRNLRNMEKDGYLTQGSDAVRLVRDRLTNADDIRRARIHPAHIFTAKKSALNVPSPIRTALEDAFFVSFGNVEPTNKRLLLALDVSSSMTSSIFTAIDPRSQVGVPTPREWSALMAMVTARSEPDAEFVGFSHRMERIDITRHDSMDEVIRKIEALPMGATDCALPMIYARKNKMKFDGFAVYTDNETWWNGKLHSWQTYYRNSTPESTGESPMGALRSYREKSGIHDAKMAVVGITSTDFTIADPNDLNTMDVVGFDANAPAVISDFFRG